MREPRDAILSLQRFFAEVLPEPWEVLRVVDGPAPERPYAVLEWADDEATTATPGGQEVSLPVTVAMYLPDAPDRKAAEDAALELRREVWQAVKWGQPPWRRLTTDRIPLFDYTGRNARQRVRVNLVAGAYTLTLDGEETGPIAFDATAADLQDELEFLPSLEEGDVVVTRRSAPQQDIEFRGARAAQPVPTLLSSTPEVLVRTLLEGAAPPVRGPSDYMRVASFAQNTIRDDDDPRRVSVMADIRLTFVVGTPIPLGQTILEGIRPEAHIP